MPIQGRGRTLVDAVYAGIKADILLGRLLPGQQLRLGELCKQHDVSLSVVREAVTRLAAEHLVQARPQQGFNVRRLSVPDLLDLTRARIEIESLTLRESIDRGDIAWEGELVAAHHRLAAMVPAVDNDAWMQAHSEFHAALASACSSPILKQIRQRLFDAAELYRYWSATLPKPRRRRNVGKEHKALLDAALAHDVERSLELIARHLQLTTDLLLAGRPAEARELSSAVPLSSSPSSRPGRRAVSP
jgi:GntR family carbon starvation induced transcriptional regulator